MEVNDYVRTKNIGFILSTSFGPSGFTFLDFGDEFIVTDTDGEASKSFIVVSASQTNPVILNVHEDKRHIYQDGDSVIFREVNGMTELNDLKPTTIQVIDGFSFKVNVDGTGFGAY